MHVDNSTYVLTSVSQSLFSLVQLVRFGATFGVNVNLKSEAQSFPHVGAYPRPKTFLLPWKQPEGMKGAY